MKPDREELIPTQASLIARLRDWKDEKSWKTFFHTYWRLIYGVARKAGLNEMEAQDVVQETLISVAKHMPTFEYDPGIGSFKSWLLTMTRWRIIGQFRKRQPGAEMFHRNIGASTKRTDFIDSQADPNALDLDAVWQQEWETNLLQSALDNLRRKMDPQHLQIFEFNVHKEWAAEKVALTFNVSVDQVYQVKHRVTNLLRVEVQRLEKELT